MVQFHWLDQLSVSQAKDIIFGKMHAWVFLLVTRRQNIILQDWSEKITYFHMESDLWFLAPSVNYEICRTEGYKSRGNKSYTLRAKSSTSITMASIAIQTIYLAVLVHYIRGLVYSKTCLFRHLLNPFPCIMQHWFSYPFHHFLCVVHRVIRQPGYSDIKFFSPSYFG